MRRLVWQAEITAKTVEALLPRANTSAATITDKVAEIIDEVRRDGLAALKRHAEKFDGVIPSTFRVPAFAMIEALAGLDPTLRSAIEESIRRVRLVSQAQIPSSIKTEVTKGGEVSLVFKPVDSAGVYVPGGKAVYPSSVIMNVVPAQVAKVPRIVLTSPAQKSNAGLPDPIVLATAALLGVEEVYAIGGASAVAALAYGEAELDLEPVQIITGPGNIFVATAKQLVRSRVAIDSEAGPTEILIIADSHANPSWVAADLISQAEHDENAAAVLLTDSAELLEAVELELARQIPLATNQTRIEAALSGEQSVLVLVDDIRTAIEIANEYAAEHLEVHAANASDLASQIRNAGAVFIGDHSPVSLGDYLAGSNHVLPTGSQAKRSAGLSVFSFLRPQQTISFSQQALAEINNALGIFANAEGLPAHGEAVRIRFKS